MTQTYWQYIETKVRAALAEATKAPNHLAWLDAMANVPYGALGAAIEEIDQLRKDNLDATTEGWRKNAEVAALRDAAVALGKANDQIDRLTKALGERDQAIAAMMETSQRVIDHAVQARERISPLGTFPVVTRIQPTVSDANPMEAGHPTEEGWGFANDPNVGYSRPGRVEFTPGGPEIHRTPRVRPSADRRDVYSAVTGCPCSECERKRELRAREALRSQRGGKLHDLVASTPKGGVILCTTEQGKKQVDAMCALQGRADIRVAMAGSWGETDATSDAVCPKSEGDGVD